ncbi:MAG: enoyl-CoA hydratase/isomerase family protein, partial [Psychrobium sp.]|nr:enoyl-CoA hydratase/isomerase family protein [Psychrobium sp.]
MSCFKNQVNGPVTLTNHGAIGVIGINNPPVNALSVAVRQGLVDCIEKAVADDSIAAIVVTCDGRTFIAGADISEFGKTPLEPHLPDVLQKLDQCSKPVVAALFGTVLGGGFEVALSCHYRVAQANTKLGLPEVTLGLIPGAGGTQLLPRIGGVELALEMISSGKPKLAKELAETAVIDLLVADELTQRAIGFANELLIQGKTARPTSQLTIGHSDQYESLFAQWRAKLAKKARGQLAPQYAIDSI